MGFGFQIGVGYSEGIWQVMVSAKVGFEWISWARLGIWGILKNWVDVNGVLGI